MKFYLAARFDRKTEMQGHAKTLQAMGHEVTSRWITGAHDGDGECTPKQLARFAEEDGHDIIRADMFVGFTEDPETSGYQSGGRHVELGFAMGMSAALVSLGKPPLSFAIVGPRENVFHHLEFVEQFDTFDAFVANVRLTDAMAAALTGSQA